MTGTVIHNPRELQTWLTTLNREATSLDTETTSLKQEELECIGLSLCDGRQSCYIDLLDGEQYNDLLRILCTEIPSIKRLIFHGAPFDMRVLAKLGIKHTKDIVCTMTAAFLLDENGEVGLKKLVVRYLGVPQSDAVPWAKASVQGFKSDLFYSYARRDAEWTWALWALLEHQLSEENLYPLFFDIEMPFQFVLRDLEMNGVLINQGALSVLREGLNEEILKLQIAVYESGGINYVTQQNLLGETEFIADVDLNSPKQLASFITDKLGVELTQQSDKTGQFSVDAHVLEGLENKHPFFHCLLDYRRASKLKQMFLEKAPEFIDSDGRIRASFNNCVAHTGRLTSSSPNLQQLPKKGTAHGSVRSLIIAPPGYTLMAADYAGQELRVLAEVSRDLTMIEAFILGKDLHLTMANQFYGLNIPEFLLYEKHPKHKDTRAKYKDQRDKSKTINFGIAYGKTPRGFSDDWNIPYDDAAAIVDRYFAAAPRVREAIERCKQFLDAHGYVVNLAGRRRRLPIGNKRSYRQAFNFLIQGFSADLVKLAAVKVHEICRQHPEWGCRIILQVHDELVYEIKTEYIDVALPVVKYTMEHVWPLSIPMVVDINTGQTYEGAK